MKNPKTIIISSADELYTPLVTELFASLRALNFDYIFDLALLDVGLKPSMAMEFASSGILVVPVQNDIEYMSRSAWEAARPGIRTLTARPFLRRYFPGYDIYIWLDADVWVQTTEAIHAMIKVASQSDAICIACELDRCYQTFFESPVKWNEFRDWYAASFPPQVVAAMALKPMLNAGVFAMASHSPIWDAWAAIYADVLKTKTELNTASFMADQLGLNILLYLKGLPYVTLPAIFNWLTYYALPKLDPITGLYVEPLPPYTPISQLHLTRPNKAQIEKIERLGGGYVERALRFSARDNSA